MERGRLSPRATLAQSDIHRTTWTTGAPHFCVHAKTLTARRDCAKYTTRRVPDKRGKITAQRPTCSRADPGEGAHRLAGPVVRGLNSSGGEGALARSNLEANVPHNNTAGQSRLGFMGRYERTPVPPKKYLPCTTNLVPLLGGRIPHLTKSWSRPLPSPNTGEFPAVKTQNKFQKLHHRKGTELQ